MDQYVFEAVLEYIRSKSYQGSEGNSESYKTPKDRAFCKNSQKEEAVHYSCKNLHPGCLTRPRICSELASKVTNISFFKSY